MASQVRTSVVIVGHVDHGKSTFIGRLLLDSGNLNPDRLQEVQKISQELGRKLEYAYLMDQFQEEREANITIDTTQVLINIEGQPLLLIDAPGHKEYLKNMITGATQARHAILMLDVNEGIREQTEKHAQILKLLGIRHAAVMINKMDLVDYGEKIFKDNKILIEELFQQNQLPSPLVIPISAYNGENVVTRSENMKWYDGPTALEFLSQCLSVGSSSHVDALRFPVQFVLEENGGSQILGRVEAGEILKGQAVQVFPKGDRVTVKRIIKYKASELSKAGAGECIALELEGATSLKRGDILSSAESPLSAAKKFEADIFWASDSPVKSGDEVLLECRTQSARGMLRDIKEQLNGTALSHLSGGDVARVIFESLDPIMLESSEQEGPLSRFVLQQRGHVVGCGVVSKVLALFLIALFAQVSLSHAYVDPGTGITFVSGLGALIWGLITLSLGAIVLTFKKWISFFKRLMCRKKNGEK